MRLFHSLLVPAVVAMTMVLPAPYLQPSSAARAAGITTRVLSGQTPSVVAHGKAALRAHHNANATLTLNVGLGVHNSAQLDALISAASNPQSAAHGHYLTPAQYVASFAPTAQEVQDVCLWAQGVGLSVAGTSPDNLLVTVRGKTPSIERALGVTINDYSFQGRAFMANDRDAQVPADLNIRSISGLSTYDRYHTMLSRSLGLHSPDGAGYYYPADFLSAYNVGALANAAGITIGLTLWGAPVPQSDLDTFAITTSTPALVSGQAGNDGIDWIPVNGVSTDQSGQVEAAMDVEYAHAMAPGSHLKYWLADTTCDASGCSADAVGLEQALDAAAHDTSVHVVSNSWGADEYNSADPNQVDMESVFQYAASVGTTFYFASGDEGYRSGSGAQCQKDPTCTTAAPMFPADSPYVVAVGGTNLQINPDYSYSNETAWGSQSAAAAGQLPGTDVGATGGGCSTVLSRPSWQTGVGAADCPGRAVPDVSADADIYSGAFVCAQGVCNDGNGGTSLAAPLWAGMAADVNAHLQASGLPVMGWAAPGLYQLANDPTTDASDFHDVVDGNNDPVVGSSNGYTATVGWDEATGWGSPNLSNLARDWPSQTVLTPTATAEPTSPTNTPTSTGTATPTSTRTATPTSTRTATPTVTRTTQPSATNTSVPTNTATSPPTATATPTGVPPTATPTRTSTATVTGTPPTAATPTASSPTATITVVLPPATATPTGVPPTATATTTVVPPTAIPTRTSTATVTGTPPATATASSPTATTTVVQPTATATTTVVPPTAAATATATTTADPPTATSQPTATATPTAVPPTATATAMPTASSPTTVPPTATATAMIVGVPPTATNTAQPRATSTTAPARATATPVRIPGLVLHVAPLTHGRLAANGTVVVTVKTRPHALVSITVAVTAKHVVYIGAGTQRKARVHTVVLATRTIHIRVNAWGRVRANVRLAYAPRTVVRGLLTVTARTSRGVARRSQRVTVLPLPHRKPGSSRP